MMTSALFVRNLVIYSAVIFAQGLSMLAAFTHLSEKCQEETGHAKFALEQILTYRKREECKLLNVKEVMILEIW